MAEVIGILASVFGVLDGLRKVNDSIQAVRSVPKDAEHLLLEVSALEEVLTGIKEKLESSNASPSTRWVKTTSLVLVKAQKTVDRLLREKLATKRWSTADKVKWTLSSKDVTFYSNQIKSFAQMLANLQISQVWQDSQKLEVVASQIVAVLDSGDGTVIYTFSPEAYQSPISSPQQHRRFSASKSPPGGLKPVKKWSLKGFALVAGIYEASRNNMGPGTLSLDECNHRARFTFQPEGGGADRSFYRVLPCTLATKGNDRFQIKTSTFNFKTQPLVLESVTDGSRAVAKRYGNLTASLLAPTKEVSADIFGTANSYIGSNFTSQDDYIIGIPQTPYYFRRVKEGSALKAAREAKEKKDAEVCRIM